MRTPVLVAAGLGLAASSLLLTVPVQAAPAGCTAGVPVDFNGDGFTDVAISNSTATEAGQAGAGRVTIRYGDSDGRVGEGAASNVRADTGNAPNGLVQTGAAFGFSTATADLDCDGYTDLVVGAPLFDNTGAVDSGSVTLLYGGPSGLTSTSEQDVLISDDFGRLRAAGDRFGYSVDAFEDLGQGGTPAPDAFALIIGVPYRDTAGRANSGAVAVLSPLDGGQDRSWIDENSPNVEGTPEAGDLFGFSVALGQLDVSGDTIDALVGVPSEDLGSIKDAGSVARLDDIYDEGVGDGDAITQDSAGVPGAAEAGDQFGRVVDVAGIGSTTRAAVAAPFEDVGSAANAGVVQLFAKSSTTQLNPGVALTQDTPGVDGAAEAYDAFGSDVAIGPGFFTAVGVPGEDGSVVDGGAMQLFRLTDLAADKTFTQATAGAPGTLAKGERFGSAVGIIDGASEDVALAGVPGDVEYADGVVNVFPFTTGTPRAWTITGSGGTFGDAFGSQGR